MRLWTKNGTEARNVDDVNAGGDFIRSDQQISITQLNMNESRVIILYSELVREKDVWSGLRANIEIIE
jgi:hypothetical protein